MRPARKLTFRKTARCTSPAPDGVGAETARLRIEALGETAEIGRIYTGKVVRVESFGAFVEILPGGGRHGARLASWIWARQPRGRTFARWAMN